HPALVKQRLIGGIFFKIPHNAFTQAGDRTTDLTSHFESNVVTRQHDFMDTTEQLRLILLNPPELCKGEIARIIIVRSQKLICVKMFQYFLSGTYGPAVAPDDGWT